MVVQKKPDVLLQGIGGPPYAAFVQQAQQFNLFSKIKVLGTYAMTADTTESFGKTYPEGIVSITWCPFYINTPAMNDFTQAFNKITNLHPGDITMTFMLSALALAAAIQQAGSTDADKLSAALEKVQFDSPIGKITVADFDHQFYTPSWVVTSINSPDWPLAVGANIIAFGNDIYPNKDQILAIRAGK